MIALPHRYFPLAVAVVLSGCPTRESILIARDAGQEDGGPTRLDASFDGGPALLMSCEEAAEAEVGTPCDASSFDGCEVQVDMCLFEVLQCVEGQLARELVPVCGVECGEDLDCPFGNLCDGGRCTPCPAAECDAGCPDPLQPLMRHGCPTCDCGFPQACGEAMATGEQICADDQLCLQGVTCVEGCDRPDCCNTACLPRDDLCSMDRVPLGCGVDCPPSFQGCMGTCVATTCGCDLETMAGWRCDVACAIDWQPLDCEIPFETNP